MSLQGSSIYTPRKEVEIGGITRMRLTQFKNPYFKYREIVCADVFCGSGKNYVQGEIVAGSPLRIMNAYRRANNTNVNFKFWFSDILPEACATLKKLLPIQNNVHVYTMTAADALNRLGKYLKDHPLTLLFLVLDPNGPKDFPKHEAIDLLSEFSRRIDIVPYISATTINRCIGARDKGGITFKGWLGSIENFDEGFVSTLTKYGRMGWIREPIKSDPQHWTILPTYGHMFPKSDWSKQGLVNINSDRGQKAIEFYNGKIGESNERI